MMNALLFWVILLLVFMVAYALGARRTAARIGALPDQSGTPPPTISPAALAALESRLAPMLAITGHKAFGNVVQFTGRLRGKTVSWIRRPKNSIVARSITLFARCCRPRRTACLLQSQSNFGPEVYWKARSWSSPWTHYLIRNWRG
jgi:hypothetical protein